MQAYHMNGTRFKKRKETDNESHSVIESVRKPALGWYIEKRKVGVRHIYISFLDQA